MRDNTQFDWAIQNIMQYIDQASGHGWIMKTALIENTNWRNPYGINYISVWSHLYCLFYNIFYSSFVRIIWLAILLLSLWFNHIKSILNYFLSIFIIIFLSALLKNSGGLREGPSRDPLTIMWKAKCTRVIQYTVASWWRKC